MESSYGLVSRYTVTVSKPLIFNFLILILYFMIYFNLTHGLTKCSEYSIYIISK